MAMESRLENMINTLEILSGINEHSEDTPLVMRHTDSKTNNTVAIVCSQKEPINMVLPLNVLWICFKPDSPLYKKMLKRISKEPGIFQKENITQDWEVLYFYEDVFEAQRYDPDDLTLIGVDPVPFASVEGPGKVKLSIDPVDPEMPVVVAEGDPRLSNDRVPKDHSHKEKPATMIAHESGYSNILDSVPVIGSALMFTESGDLEWRKISQDDLV